jgi:hypothetical protein
VNGVVSALASYPAGRAARLYAGGAFDAAGGVSADNLARWDGASWSALPAQPNSTVTVMRVWDDGSGPALFVGGAFTHVGAQQVGFLGKWDGSTWYSLSGGLDGIVRALEAFDDGTGPALYVGGDFMTAGGVASPHLARWKGGSWSSVGGGTNARVLALAAFDPGDGGGPDLYVGGDFTNAGGFASRYAARWNGCPGPGTLMCFGDGSLATPCPCGNFGTRSRGCAHSSSSVGASLRSSGTTRPDTVILHATDERPTALTIVLQGNEALAAGAAFGDGLRCASGVLKRLYVKNASGGVVSAPVSGDPSITTRSAALGDPIAPGTWRIYQTYYRDANAGFCPPPSGSTFNSSNAVRIVW